MIRNILTLSCWAILLLTTTVYGQFAEQIDIPYEKFVLDNGLTLLVHEDHKAPIVAVNVWYHVGSKDERPGITGFAHLFEHLMFNGSENYKGEWFLPLERAGGPGSRYGALDGVRSHGTFSRCDHPRGFR